MRIMQHAMEIFLTIITSIVFQFTFAFDDHACDDNFFFHITGSYWDFFVANWEETHFVFNRRWDQ